MSYIRLSNIHKDSITRNNLNELEELLRNDLRVINFNIISKDELIVEINLGHDQFLNGSYSFGKVASLLHCSEYQARENEINNKYDRTGINIDDKTIALLYTSGNPTISSFSDSEKIAFNLQIQRSNHGYTVSINHKRIDGFFRGNKSILKILKEI